MLMMSKMLLFPYLSLKYLEWRFDKKTRLLGSACFTLQMVLYMAIVVYTPALALSQGRSSNTTSEELCGYLMTIPSLSVTGIDVDVACVIIFIVCIFYTAAVSERA